MTTNSPAQEQKIEDIIKKDTRLLYQTSSVFPFDLFPIKIFVYLTHLDIVDRIFFMTRAVESLLIKDVFSVQLNTSPFLASLTLTSRQPMLPEVTIKKLSKSKGKELYTLIQGLIIAHNYKIELTNLEIPEMVAKIKELGTSAVTQGA